MGGWKRQAAARPRRDDAEQAVPGGMLNVACNFSASVAEAQAISSSGQRTCPYVPTTVEARDILHPASRPLDDVKASATHSSSACANSSAQARRDPQRRTAHQSRPRALLPTLAEEFEGERSATEIRAYADAVLARSDNVPIRSHILMLAHPGRATACAKTTARR